MINIAESSAPPGCDVRLAIGLPGGNLGGQPLPVNRAALTASAGPVCRAVSPATDQACLAAGRALGPPLFQRENRQVQGLMILSWAPLKPGQERQNLWVMSPDRLSPGPGMEEMTAKSPVDGSQPRLLLAEGR